MVSWADPRSVPRWFPRTGDTSSGGGGQEARERGPGRRSGGTPSSRWAWVRPTSAPSPCLTPVPLWQFYADLIFSFSYKDQNVKMTEHTRESVNSRELWLLGTWVSARLRRHRRTSVPDQEYSSSRHRQSFLRLCPARTGCEPRTSSTRCSRTFCHFSPRSIFASIISSYIKPRYTNHDYIPKHRDGMRYGFPRTESNFSGLFHSQLSGTVASLGLR